MVSLETTTFMKICFQFLVNVLKLFKGAKFDYDQIKEENVIKNGNFQFLFLTTLIKTKELLKSLQSIAEETVQNNAKKKER